MAKIEFSALITDLKGSTSGTTFKGGNSSPVLMKKRKTKSKPIDVGGSGDNSATLRMQKVSKSWCRLNEVEKGTWDALKGVRGFKNSFGKQYVGSAYQIFSSMNNIRLLLGEEMLIEAPVFDPSPLVPLELSSVDDCESPWGTFIDCEELEALLDVGRVSEHAFVVQMSRGTNSGRTPVRLNFNVVGIHYFIDEAPICLTCLYATFFGVLPPFGSTVWVKISDMYKGYPVHQNERLYKWVSNAAPTPP
jgi:hypothetical protein